MLLSVITPVYKGEKGIYDDFIKKYNYIQSKLKSDDFELIFVFDGKLENDSTVLEKYILENNIKNVQLIRREINKGKGYSVREGFAKANGDYFCFIDFNPEVDIHFVIDGLNELVAQKKDFLICNRFSKKSKYKVSIHRKLASFGFYIFNKFLFSLKKIDFPDTQGGFKIIRKEVYKKVESNLTIERFAFDVELVAFLLKESFKPVLFPISYIREKGNKSSVKIKDIFIMANDSIKIWQRI